MELSGTLTAHEIDYTKDKVMLTFRVNEKQSFLTGYDEIAGKELSITAKPLKKKRSLDANAYCWVLLDKLACNMNLTKEEVYRNAIKEIGGNSDVVCIKTAALESLCKGWEHNGIGWQVDTFPSKIDGCTNVILYYGSSTYNTEQMSRLIDNIVQDCKAQGIETKTPAEIASLIDLWKGDR